MAQTIKVKRSSSATNPANLKEGEIAYIHSTDTAGKFYIGRPGSAAEGSDVAGNIDAIGGKIYIDKLDLIEDGATADQTASEIRALVESALDSNVFTDADHTKLGGIATSANNYTLPSGSTTVLGGIKLGDDTAISNDFATTSTTDGRDYPLQINGTGLAAVNVPWTDTTYSVGDGGLTQNNFTNADHIKLNGIEASADVTDSTNVQDAGALMDSECTSVASVKAINQGLATTNSPSFVNVTASGELDGATLDISGNGDIAGDVSLGTAESIGTGTAENPEVPQKNVTVRGNLAVDKNMTVTGNLTVSGTTTTVNSETIQLADNIIELNSNAVGNSALGTAVLNGGINVNRGTGNDADGNPIFSSELKWDEANGYWSTRSATTTAYAILTANNYGDFIDEIDGGTFS